MKKLKQLKLKKQTVVNLNDSEMKQIQGGNVWTTLVPYTIDLTKEIYSFGAGQSYWNCQDPGTPAPYPNTTVSNEFMWVNNVQYCRIPEVNVYGLNTVYP